MKFRFSFPLALTRAARSYVRLAVAAALILFAGSAEASFNWLTPSTNPRVILTANQDLAGFMEDHPDWFAHDFLVASFFIDNVVYGQSDAAKRSYAYLRNKLWRYNIDFGTYVSGTTAIPELSLTRFPPDAVSIEDLSVKTHYLGPWIRDRTQMVVDFRDIPSMLALEGGIINLWLHAPGTIRFIDNAAIHPKVMPILPWELYCLNIKRLRLYNESKHAISIFNVFARPWELTDKETAELIDAVAGSGYNAISFPIPWSRKIKDDKNAVGWAAYRYRQMLDHGVVLILAPSADADNYELTNWIASWRRPLDRVYVATPFTQAPY